MISRDDLIGIACHEGKEFLAIHKTLADAWDACQRPDWMFWALEQINWSDERIFRLFMCWCAMETPLADGLKTGDLLTHPDSIKAVEVARRFANGEATAEELSAAWSAALSAALSPALSPALSAALSPARSAAWSAARSAALSAALSPARSAAWSAAWSAAESAAWSAAESAAWSAARSVARSAQADQLRVMVGNPFALSRDAGEGEG